MRKANRCYLSFEKFFCGSAEILVQARASGPPDTDRLLALAMRTTFRSFRRSAGVFVTAVSLGRSELLYSDVLDRC